MTRTLIMFYFWLWRSSNHNEYLRCQFFFIKLQEIPLLIGATFIMCFWLNAYTYIQFHSYNENIQLTTYQNEQNYNTNEEQILMISIFQFREHRSKVLQGPQLTTYTAFNRKPAYTYSCNSHTYQNTMKRKPMLLDMRMNWFKSILIQ